MSEHNNDPTNIIYQQEMTDTINKIGSLISLMVNKPISCVTFFSILQSEPHLQKILIELSDASWYTLIEYMAFRWPVLNKSKKIK